MLTLAGCTQMKSPVHVHVYHSKQPVVSPVLTPVNPKTGWTQIKP